MASQAQCPPKQCVHLERSYQVPIVLAAGELNTNLQQVVDSDGEFIWRGVRIPSTSALSNCRIRFQVNDYFLSNVRIPLLFYAFQANQAKAFEREIRVRPGGKILIEAQAPTTAYTGVIILIGVTALEGGN